MNRSPRVPAMLVAALCLFASGTARAEVLCEHAYLSGRATLEDVEVRLTCTNRTESHRCSVDTRARIHADESVTLRLVGCVPYDGDRPWGDGTSTTEDRVLEPGESAEFRLRERLEVDLVGGFERLLTHPALGLRHPWLGESWIQYSSTQRVVVMPIRGDRITEGEVHVEGTSGRVHFERVDCRVERCPGRGIAARVVIAPPHGGPPEGPLANGGPAITLGGVLNGTFRVGLGYEIGFFEVLIASGWVEVSDLDVSEVILVEAALPGGLFFIWPSLSGGIGFVATQRFDGSVLGALRIRLAAQTYMLGFAADLDYRLDSGDWQIALSLRAGI